MRWAKLGQQAPVQKLARILLHNTFLRVILQHRSKRAARKLSVRRQVDEKQFSQWFKATEKLMIIFLLVFLHILYNPINPDKISKKHG